MTNENYTVDILVNDKPLRKFPHNDKLFVEAHKGAEYSIRIKNNSYGRILAVSSVDGLDVLNGKAAKEDGNGYVINGYNSLTIDGFRLSNEQVAKFLFDYKGGSYAASKEDGSERNVGVVGVRLFTEKVQPPPPVTIVREEHHHWDHNYPYPNYPKYPKCAWSPYWTTTWLSSQANGDQICGTTYGSTGMGMGDAFNSLNIGNTYYSMGMENETLCDSDMQKYSCDNIPTKGLGATLSGKGILRHASNSAGSGQKRCAINFCSTQNSAEALGFDMGTKWGGAKESKVIEVEFEKGILALTTNIYYASRQSLIEMGIHVGNEKQVSFPEPFGESKYSTPPKGWTP